MSQFEYVMVPISIIVGSGLAHLLLGVEGIIDRLAGKKKKLELSVAHAAWLVATFGWLILYRCWQFRLTELVEAWTVQQFSPHCSRHDHVVAIPDRVWRFPLLGP